MMLSDNGKSLIKSIFGSSTSAVSILEESKTVLPLTMIITNLLKLSDEDWGMYAFSKEPLDGKFDLTEKREYIKKSTQCGVYEAVLISAKYENHTMEDIASNLELEVDTQDMPNGGDYVIFAQYMEPKKITIFMDTIKKAEPLIKDQGIKELLGDIDIYHLLLAHEIFHGIEFHKKNTIYTQTEKIELWKKPFSNLSRIICLGEIAGMSFAKELLKLNYSPFVFDVILMYGYNKEAATALYESIIEIVNDTEYKTEYKTN
ncbi:hypothetical protein [[Clostridium] fimetarium]|uniref:Uncharacterized protein n=1 Tax=[Clostridium] fimetarium TaxID=99656 RepID=A0A1I0NRS6_9FIRM|nr:hypothetical protein [[Clostridium] fimetarium]SEW04101.1 hypothetical protein SAMN05421659_103317 [[Clostridium] fimetarium]